MATWSDLPDEVVLQIVERLRFYTYKEQWKFVNKELYEAYQSFQYKIVAVDLQDTSKREVNALLNSPLEPGKHIKTLLLENLKTAADLKEINRATDPSYKLMERCPA